MSELLQAQLMLKATQGKALIFILTPEETEGRPWEVESGGSCWGFLSPRSSDVRLLFLGPQSVTHAPVDPPPVLSLPFSRGAILSSSLGQNPRFSQLHAGGAKAGLVISELCCPQLRARDHEPSSVESTRGKVLSTVLGSPLLSAHGCFPRGRQ